MKALARAYHYKESDGKKIGTHIGAQYYTIGQRKGLNIGGHREPIFVLDTSVQTNTIYVGEGHEHPGLMRRALFDQPQRGMTPGQFAVWYAPEDLEMLGSGVIYE